MTPETAPKPACYPVSGSKPEPAPSGNGVLVTPSLLRALRSRDERIHSALADLVDARDAFGRAKYGTGLRAANGRDPLEDARQELGDLLQYLWQAKMEEKNIWHILNMLSCAHAFLVHMDAPVAADFKGD